MTTGRAAFPEVSGNTPFPQTKSTDTIDQTIPNPFFPEISQSSFSDRNRNRLTTTMIRDARGLRAGFVPRESSIATPRSITSPASSNRSRTASPPTPHRDRTQRCREDLSLEVRHRAPSRGSSRHRSHIRQLLAEQHALSDAVSDSRRSRPDDRHSPAVDAARRTHRQASALRRSRTVVLLDEADQLGDPDLIYDLHRLPQFAVICITNNEEMLLSLVDDRLVSRLRPAEHVRMDKYHDE